MTGLGGSSGVGPSSSSNKGTYDLGGGGLFGSDILTHSALRSADVLADSSSFLVLS